MTVTCDEFLTSVKRLVTVPATQALLSDTDILAMATDIMRGDMIAMIDGVNQEYFVTKSSPLNIVAGQSSYRIPSRAVGRKLREVQVQDNASLSVYSLPLINLDLAQQYNIGGSTYGFRFEGDRVVIMPAPISDTGYSLVFYYAAAPGKLVKAGSAGVVTAISADDVTIDTVPTAFAVGRRYDFIAGESGNGYLGISALVTNVTTNTLTFATGSVPLDLAVGDYLSLSGESPVIQVPEELMPYMQALTAMDCLQSISDFEGMDKLKDKVKKLEANALSVIAPRVNGEAQIIINKNGLLHGRGGRRNFAGLFRG